MKTIELSRVGDRFRIPVETLEGVSTKIVMPKLAKQFVSVSPYMPSENSDTEVSYTVQGTGGITIVEVQLFRSVLNDVTIEVDVISGESKSRSYRVEINKPLLSFSGDLQIDTIGINTPKSVSATVVNNTGFDAKIQWAACLEYPELEIIGLNGVVLAPGENKLEFKVKPKTRVGDTCNIVISAVIGQSETEDKAYLFVSFNRSGIHHVKNHSVEVLPVSDISGLLVPRMTVKESQLLVISFVSESDINIRIPVRVESFCKSEISVLSNNELYKLNEYESKTILIDTDVKWQSDQTAYSSNHIISVNEAGTVFNYLIEIFVQKTDKL